MTRIYFLLLLCIVSYSAVAENWTWQVPVPTRIEFTGIFTDGDIIVAGGPDHPGIYISPDSGRSWIHREHPFSSSFPTLFHVYGDSSICAEWYQNILSVSHDRGATWQDIQTDFLNIPEDEEGFLDVFTDPLNSLYLHTTVGMYISNDGGATWTVSMLPEGNIRRYSFDESGVLYLQNDDKLYVRISKSADWEMIVPGDLTSCAVSREGTVFIIRGQTIQRSTDQGKSWETVASNVNDAVVTHASGVDTVFFSQSYNAPPAHIRYRIGFLINNGGWHEKPCTGMSSRHGLTDSDYTISVGNLWLTTISDVLMVSRNNGLDWESTGSSYGTFRHIDVDADNHLYLGRSPGGVLRSDDGGDTWRSDSKGLDVLNDMESLNLDDNGNLFAATAEGIFVKRKAEEQWTYCYGSDDLSGAQLIGVGGGKVVASVRDWNEQVLFLLSGDEGRTWDTLSSDVPLTRVVIGDMGTMFGISCEKVYRFNNSSNEWTEIDAPQIHCPAALYMCRNGSLLLSTGGPTEEDFLVYRSNDGGKTWMVIEALRSVPIQYFQGMQDGSVWVIGNSSLRSDDCGLTWFFDSNGWRRDIATDTDGHTYSVDRNFVYSRDSNPIWEFCYGRDGADFRAIATTPSGVLLAATDVAIFISSDSGATWQSHGKLPDSFLSIEMIALSEDVVIISSPYSDIAVSTDGGRTFTQRSILPIRAIKFLTAISEFTFAAVTNSDQLVTSSDYGVTWSDPERLGDDLPVYNRIAIYEQKTYIMTPDDLYVKNGLPGSSGDWERRSASLGLYGITFDSDGTMYAYGSSLYRSFDKGMQWEQVKGDTRWGQYPIHSLEISGDRVLARTQYETFLSADWGESWDDAPGGTFIAALGKYLFSGGGGRLFRLAAPVATSIQETLPLINKTGFAILPHPAYGESSIRFVLGTAGAVNISLYSITGSTMRTIDSGEYSIGEHTIQWDTVGLAPGVYICVLTTVSGERVAQTVIIQ